MQRNTAACARCSNTLEKAAIFVKIGRKKASSVRPPTSSSSSSTRQKFSVGPDIQISAAKTLVGRRNWLSWHRSCFRCINCKTNLSAKQFQLKTNDSTTAAAHFCPECWLKMYSKQCAGCVTPLTEKGLLAMDVLWHEDCFRCANCMSKITDHWYCQDTGPKRPTCFECTIRPPDEEKLRQLRLINAPPKTMRRRKKKRRNKNRQSIRSGGIVDDNNGKNNDLNGCKDGLQENATAKKSDTCD